MASNKQNLDKDALIYLIEQIVNGDEAVLEITEGMIRTTSGTRVYYQPTEPTGGDYKVDDTWYKTLIADDDDDQYVLHVWDGEKWDGRDFDGKLIRAGSITAQEIASNTITANEVNMDNLQTKLARIGNKESKHIVLNDDEIDFNNMELTHTKITPSGVSFAYENFIISYDDAEGKTHIHVRAKDGSGRWEAGEALVVAQPVSTVVPESDYIEALSTETYIDEIIYENSFVKIKFDQSLPVTYIVNRLNGILGDRFKAQKNYVYSLDASGDFPRVVFNCDVETTESIFAKGLKTTGNAIVGGTLKATGDATFDSNLNVGGNGAVDGTLTIGGHNQEIGYANSSGNSKSVASGASFSDMTSFTLSPGTWMLVGQVYGNITSGKRFGSVWALNYGSGAENYLASRNIISTGASGNHATQSVLVVRNTARVTAYLRAFHTNGSALTLDYAWRLVRIA